MKFKLKSFFTVILGAILIVNLLTSTLSVFSHSSESGVKAEKATDLSAQYIKLVEADTTTAEQLDVNVIFSPYLSEPIHIPVPENLIYNEDVQILQGENRVYLDTIKNEIVIQPSAQQKSETVDQTSSFAIENLSEELVAPADVKEQMVSIEFSAAVDGEYMLKATTSYEGSEVNSDELNATVTVPKDKETEKIIEETTDSSEVDEEVKEETKAEEESVPPESSVRSIAARDITITDNVADVTDWIGFRTAIRNPDINVINIMNDIENTAGTSASYNDTQVTGYSITRDLEINGNGHRMNFKGTSMRVGTPAAGTTPTFHLHDFSYLNQDGSPEDLVGSGGYGGGYNTTVARWKWKFGNIVTSRSVNSASVGIRRIARLATAEITLYGNNDIQTQGENFYAGSMIIEPGARWKGTVTYWDFSVVWYQAASPAGATGASREFTVGANANVQLGSNKPASRTYPAIYQFYQAMTIGENAVYNVGMPGNAVRFDSVGASMTVKKGAITNLTSTSNGTSGTNNSAVSFSANNTTFTAEPGSFVYIIGNSTQPLVNMSSNGTGTGNAANTGNKFILDNPAQYDIRNIRDGNYPAIRIYYANSPSINEFRVVNSDIDLWDLNTTILGPSSSTYAMVEQLSVLGGGTTQSATSTEATLAANFKSDKYRRISGMNQNPTVEFDSVITDAHLTVKARVKIGEVPDNNGANEAGDVTYIPVYASQNQAKATITDTHGVVHADLPTDVNGYVTYKDTVFNKAGLDLTGSAVRGPWLSEVDGKTTIVDVTPPTPAELSGPVRLTSKSIKGVNGEPGATVSYTVNGQDATKDGVVITTEIQADGTWELAVPTTKLELGDTIQFFLTDVAGNKNPVTQTSLYDAVFPKGTIAIVQDGMLQFLSAPTVISFGDEMLLAAKTTSYPIVSMDQKLTVEDTRQTKASWTLTAKMNQILTSGTNKTLPQALQYTKNGVSNVLGTSSIVIYENTNTSDDPLSISDNWIPSGDGLSVKVKPGEAYSEAYEGEIEWTLQDTP